jgi:tRNA nucleotidyltransferase/poly(A) polymerase
VSRAQDPVKARHTATRIVQTLRAAGHNALFAGGCVRDELLGLHPTDYDVATSATPPQVRRLFQSVHEVGEAFGVMLVTLDHTTVEVATFRTDGQYTDKRRPDAVTFADDKADAQRRDFTINALFLDPLSEASANGKRQTANGEQRPSAGLPPIADSRLPIAGPSSPAFSPLGGQVIDYVNGLADLRSKTLRAVGDPDARLNEDHLRALRAVRFAARLNFQIDPATATAIRAHAAQLKGVSRERIGEEVRRMLTHTAPGAKARAAALLQDLTLDAPALNEPNADAPLTTLSALPPTAPYTANLAAWLIDRHSFYTVAVQPSLSAHQAVVTRVRSALCLTNTERDELVDLFACLDDLLRNWLDRPIAGQKRWASRWGFSQAVNCLAPHHQESADRIRGIVAKLAADGIGLHPPLLVDGDDLIGLGFKPGPVFKSLLDRLYDEQLEGRLKTKAEGMELAKLWGV